jgi:hypothetical protein
VLEAIPNASPGYEPPTVKNVDRSLLCSKRYHVYYVVIGEIGTVPSVWSAVRGSGSELKPPS